MYDIHTHLYWESYDADRDEVLRRARESGVEKMIVIGTTVEESRQAVALAEEYPDLYASVGIHPHFFSEFAEKQFQNPKSKFQNKVENIETLKQALKTLVQRPKVVAIGECGLDYYVHDEQKAMNSEQKTVNNEQRTVSRVQKAAQREGFEAQIELASELGLPLIVHCRASSPTSDDAYRDLLHILQATNYKLPAILHCYLGGTEVTREFMGLPNVFFSFAGNITYPVKKAVRETGYDIRETVKLVPLERLFVETDCPFLAPQAHRGKRNEPAFVGAVAAQVAEMKGVSQGEVEAQSTRHAIEVFGILG